MSEPLDNGVESRLARLEKSLEALATERQRAVDVASEEREKAAVALRIALERAIAEGDDRLREHVSNQITQIKEALLSADKLELARVSRVEENAKAQFESLKEATVALRDEKFDSVQRQFHERDLRFDQAAKDRQLAVAAAFAAQKEAAAEQNRSNTLAISKSEVAMAEKVDKLAELFKTTTDGLRDKIDDIKAEVNGARSIKQGGQEQRQESRAVVSNTSALVGIAVALLGALALYFGVHSQRTPAVVQPTVTVTTPSK